MSDREKDLLALLSECRTAFMLDQVFAGNYSHADLVMRITVELASEPKREDAA